MITDILAPDDVDLVLFHGSCFDGFTAAWCAWLSLGTKAEYVACYHGAPRPNVQGRKVLMVDFAYKRPILQEMFEEADRLLVLDHHKDKLEEWLPKGYTPATTPVFDVPICAVNGSSKAHLHFDMGHSGAMLSAKYFARSDQGKMLGLDTNLVVLYVEDRDLWRFNLPNSRAINEALKGIAFDFGEWTMFSRELHDETSRLRAGFDRVADRGAAMMAMTEQALSILEQTAVLSSLDGQPMWIVNAPYTIASELANRLAQRRDGPGVALAWRYDHAKRQIGVSLRSTAASGVDVCALAVARGGGGHERAAGFEITDAAIPWSVNAITFDTLSVAIQRTTPTTTCPPYPYRPGPAGA